MCPICEVQGCKAPPTDLELTHYWQRVPQKEEKNWEKISGLGLSPLNACG